MAVVQTNRGQHLLNLHSKHKEMEKKSVAQSQKQAGEGAYLPNVQQIQGEWKTQAS